MNGLDATTQLRILPEYEANTMKLMLKALVTLKKNPLSEMRTQDWRVVQVTITTSWIPLEGDTSLEKRKCSIVYDKYMRNYKTNSPNHLQIFNS